MIPRKTNGAARVAARRPASHNQVGVRLPADLVEALDAACKTRRVRRRAIIVAALRKHLGKLDPAEVVEAK